MMRADRPGAAASSAGRGAAKGVTVEVEGSSPRQTPLGRAPIVWLLIGDKLGDNAQARTLADALGWPYATRLALPKPEWVLGKPGFRPGLHHLDPVRSSVLEPPWPDLVLTIGRRPSMAALWVRERSGGRSRVVLIGRPKKRWLDHFALVIVPAQFHVPAHPRVVRLGLPLMRADAAAVAAAAAIWRPRLEALPRPLTAVMVGGRTKPFRFDAAVATGLVRELAAVRARDGGTLYLTTSRRTQPEIQAALTAALPEDAILYRWLPDAADNPYLALLGLADRVVVTGDSVSMMIEVAGLGRPLAIAALPLEASLEGRLLAVAGRLLERGVREDHRTGRLFHLVHRLGLAGYARDLTAIHRELYARGLAVPLGQPFPDPGRGLERDLAPIVARIRALVD